MKFVKFFIWCLYLGTRRALRVELTDGPQRSRRLSQSSARFLRPAQHTHPEAIGLERRQQQ
jgi:hypothetical protein